MTFYDELLQKYGYIEEPLVGVNADGEDVIVSIDKECACTRTLQHNGWQRVNIYYPDGTCEEYYER